MTFSLSSLSFVSVLTGRRGREIQRERERSACCGTIYIYKCMQKKQHTYICIYIIYIYTPKYTQKARERERGREGESESTNRSLKNTPSVPDAVIEVEAARDRQFEAFKTVATAMWPGLHVW